MQITIAPPDGWENRLTPGYDPPIERVVVEAQRGSYDDDGALEAVWSGWDSNAIGHLFMLYKNDHWPFYEEHILDVLVACPFDEVCDRLESELRRELRGHLKKPLCCGMDDDNWHPLAETMRDRCPDRLLSFLVSEGPGAEPKHWFHIVNVLRSFEGPRALEAAHTIWDRLATHVDADFRLDAYRLLYEWDRPDRKETLVAIYRSLDEKIQRTIDAQNEYVDSRARARELMDATGSRQPETLYVMSVNMVESMIDFEDRDFGRIERLADGYLSTYSDAEIRRRIIQTRNVLKNSNLVDRDRYEPPATEPSTVAELLEDIAQLLRYTTRSDTSDFYAYSSVHSGMSVLADRWGDRAVSLLTDIANDEHRHRDTRFHALMTLAWIGSPASMEAVLKFRDSGILHPKAPVALDKYSHAENMARNITLIRLGLGYENDVATFYIESARLTADYKAAMIHTRWHRMSSYTYATRRIGNEWFPIAIIAERVI